jgi:iron complex transport system substrate-binding protein
MGRLIQDAGGKYLWEGLTSDAAVPMGIENVFMKALTADYWLNAGSARSLKEISLVDKRLEDLPCYHNDNIYNNDKRITTDGGNDYWETGIIYPHMVLKDIASILHHNLFKDYNMVYYRRIK